MKKDERALTDAIAQLAKKVGYDIHISSRNGMVKGILLWTKGEELPEDITFDEVGTFPEVH